MDLTQRFGILFNQRSNASRLVSAEILRHDTSRRQEDRILRVHVFGRRPVIDPVETRLAVRMIEPSALKKPRCTGMIERGAGPEDAHVLFDLSVRHPAVIGSTAL